MYSINILDSCLSTLVSSYEKILVSPYEKILMSMMPTDLF